METWEVLQEVEMPGQPLADEWGPGGGEGVLAGAWAAHRRHSRRLGKPCVPEPAARLAGPRPSVSGGLQPAGAQRPPPHVVVHEVVLATTARPVDS